MRSVLTFSVGKLLVVKTIPAFMLVFVLALLSTANLATEYVEDGVIISVPGLSDFYLSSIASDALSAASPEDFQTTRTSETGSRSRHLPSISRTMTDGEQASYFYPPVPTSSNCHGSLMPLCRNVVSRNQLDRSLIDFVSLLLVLAVGQNGRGVQLPFRPRRRSRIDVVAEILRVSAKGARKTRIIQSANLNSRIIEEYLSNLEQSNLIQRLTLGGTIFVTTSKGLLFLTSYVKMQKLLDERARLPESNSRLVAPKAMIAETEAS